MFKIALLLLLTNNAQNWLSFFEKKPKITIAHNYTSVGSKVITLVGREGSILYFILSTISAFNNFFVDLF